MQSQFSNLVVDYSGTLSFDLYFRSLGQDFLAHVQELMFRDDKSVTDRWMAGTWTARDVAVWLSSHTGRNAVDIEIELRRGCACMSLNASVMELVQDTRSKGLKSALVTINADVFTKVVVPTQNLHEFFDVIVNSADQREIDKRQLWKHAFCLLGPEAGYSNSLLIDDSKKSVEWFREAGGTAYHYQQDDDQLNAWVARHCL
ncbi:MAG TPA: hypothetical protein VNQ76_01480 [Planctomicrobium sp.]|nr:hypothetical protein [Planctomicrobium sp.]